MKKAFTLIFVVLFLSACSSKNMYSYLSNGDDVIFTGPGNVSYTYNDLYKSLKVSSADTIENEILLTIANGYEIDREDLERQAQEAIDLYVQLGYEDYLISYYGSLDAYKEIYVSNLILNELAKVYVNENYDTLKENDLPVKMQLASFDSVEEAQKCIDDFNNGSTFDMAAINNNSLNTPQSSVYTDSDSSLVYEVKDYLNSTDTTGVSSIIKATSMSKDDDGNNVETYTYYVLNIESRDPDEFKEDYINLAATNASMDTVNEYFFSSHELKFFDQDIYEIMSEKFEELK
ncbi:MAG: hypothetical protein J5365_01070 [Erysipelotrichaceae bacterium]|nr:hypothetical protein [Erysipelotrichaceae bacterium]